MIANAPIIEAVADCLMRHAPDHVVLDPVMVTKSGDHLLAPEAVEALPARLVPLASVVTSNLPEAAVLLGRDGDWTAQAMGAELPALLELGSDWVLLKGGHLSGSTESVDLLHDAAGTIALPAPRIDTTNDHGTVAPCRRRSWRSCRITQCRKPFAAPSPICTAPCRRRTG